MSETEKYIVATVLSFLVFIGFFDQPELGDDE